MYVSTAVPVAIAETVPDETPTVATDVLLLLHEPPGEAVYVVVEPVQTDDGPEILAGVALVVNVPLVELIHPFASV